MTTSLQTTVHDRLDAVDAERWDALAMRMRAPTIYHTHDWASCWWKHLREPDQELRLIVARRGTEPVALLPLIVLTQRKTKLLRRRILTCLTAVSPAFAQYLGPICPAEEEDEAIDAFARVVAGMTGFDAIYFENYLAGNLIARLTEAMHPLMGGPPTNWSGESTHRIALSATPELYLQSISHNLRRKIRTTRRLWEKAPGARIERIGDEEGLNAALETLRRQSIQRFGRHHSDSTFLDARMFAFFSELMSSGLRRGRDAFFSGWLDDRIVATHFGLHFGRWIGYYNGSFESGFERLSPGTMMFDAMIRDAIERGLDEVDLLAGFSRYKQRWSQNNAEELQYAVYSRGGARNFPFTWWERRKSRRQPTAG